MGKIFLYSGEEEFLKKEEIEKLKNSYEGKVVLYSFSPQDKEFSMEEILRLSKTKNLFSSHQIILINDFEKISSKDRDSLLSYLRNPSEFTDLILITKVKIKKINNGNDWLKILLKESNLKVKEFSPLSEEELKKWIVIQAHKQGKGISSLAVNFLVNKLGNNTSSLAQAIEKAYLYIKEKKIIEWVDLEDIIGKEVSFDIYKMLDALWNKELSKSIVILKNIQEFKEKPDRIIGVLVGEWRKLFLAKKLLRQGLDENRIIRQLNLFYADKFFSNLRKITLDKLKKSLRHLLYIDYAIKTGKLNPFFAIESWIIEFFS